MTRFLKCTVAGLRNVVDGFLIVTFLLMFGSVLLQIFVRTFTQYSLVGTEEVAKYSQLWLVLIGSGVAIRLGRHVAVDVLISLLPAKLRLVITLINNIAILWFLAMIFEGSLPLIDMGMFQKSPALGTPMWGIYASLMVGAVYMALELILSMFTQMSANPASESVSSEMS